MSHIQLFLHASGSIVSEEEILDAIPKSTLARIKEKDPKPYFRAFVVAHEGVADPFIQGVKKVIKVVRATIESMARRMPGAKYFDDYHKKTGPRNEIGTEVAFIQKEVNGNLHDISIAYGDPSQRDRLASKDIVSMEADVDVAEMADGTSVLGAIKSIFAYATGKLSDGALPAWSGAKAVGALYAFSTELTQQQEKNKMSDPVRSPFPLTPDGFPDPVSTQYSHAEQMIKSFLKAKTVKPSQILSWDAIFGERTKGPGGETLWTGGDREFRDRIFKHEQDLIKPFQEQISVLEKFRDEAISYRTKDFRVELIKSAQEEAKKHKFDDKLTGILVKRLEKSALSVDPSVMLLEEKERTTRLETLKADVIKNTIEDVRSEWASTQPQRNNAGGAGGGEGGIGDDAQDYSGGTSDDGENW